MNYLFTKNAVTRLKAFISKDPLYAFDFDGTLAPLCARPGDAALLPGVREALRIVANARPVVVISGRSVSDLKPRLMGCRCYLVGNHGLEGFSAKKGSAQKLRQVCVGWKSQLNHVFERGGPIQGILLEDKAYSLALHYRAARRRQGARAYLLRATRVLQPQPRIVTGKCVINLVPEGARNKGGALGDVMRQLQRPRALFIGDDDTDEDVFNAAGPNLFTVRVGRKQKSGAKYYLKNQAEIKTLLDLILLEASATKVRQPR